MALRFGRVRRRNGFGCDPGCFIGRFNTSSSSSRTSARRTPITIARDEMVAPEMAMISSPSRSALLTCLPTNCWRKRASRDFVAVAFAIDHKLFAVSPRLWRRKLHGKCDRQMLAFSSSMIA